MKVKLNPKQTQVYDSEAFETVYTSGVGGGKTFILAMLIYRAISVPKELSTLTLLVSPTHEVMKTATWKGVTKAFDKIGFQYGVHYVVNERPPKEWNVPVYSRLNSAKIITWRSGSYTIVGSLERFNNVRGAEYDQIYVDEFRDIKWKESRDVLIARARGDSYIKQGKQQQIYYVSTPPDNVRQLKEVVSDPSVNWVHGTSFDNKANLPPGYIERMIRIYDQRTKDREVFGKLVDNKGDNLFAYAYDPEYTTVDFEEYGYKLKQTEPVRLSFDFNVNPSTCLVGQSEGDVIRIFKTFQVPGGTPELCDAVLAWIPFDCEIHVTGDVSGFKKDTRSKLNDYQIILSKFGIGKHALKIGKTNQSISDSKTLTNSILANADVAIDKNNCVHLHEDLLYVTLDDNGKIDKNKHGAHTLDNFRYYLAAWHRQFLIRNYG